jgi:hypothetical protein
MIKTGLKVFWMSLLDRRSRMKTYALNRVIRVIKSCKTVEQIRVADKYAKLAAKKFGTNRVNQMNLLQLFLKAKIEQLEIMMEKTESLIKENRSIMEHLNEL